MTAQTFISTLEHPKQIKATNRYFVKGEKTIF